MYRKELHGQRPTENWQAFVRSNSSSWHRFLSFRCKDVEQHQRHFLQLKTDDLYKRKALLASVINDILKTV